MKRVALIVNPRAGSQPNLKELIPAMLKELASRGVEGEAIETTGPGSASALAANAIANGGEAVFACGGDGTIHEVIQGAVGREAALGVIPLGTANALARNLGLSREPLRALGQQADAKAVKVAVGEVTYAEAQRPKKKEIGFMREEVRKRFFLVMAGAGPDGALVYSLLAGQKSRLGRSAYYAHAAKLFVTREFSPFRIQYRPMGSSIWEEDLAVSVMCARVGDLGGIFSRLATGSSLHSKSLRMTYLRPPGWASLPSWFVSGQLGFHTMNPWLKTMEVEEFRCEPVSGSERAHAQVDGEWIGRLPITVRLIPDALSLLIPSPHWAPGGNVKVNLHVLRRRWSALPYSKRTDDEQE